MTLLSNKRRTLWNRKSRRLLRSLRKNLLSYSAKHMKPCNNFRDAMMREDRQEWAAAQDKEYM